MIDKSIAILGSTGSVGSQAIEIAEHLGIRVDLLTASSSVDIIEKQARKLKPKACVLTDEKCANELKIRLSDTDIKVYSGEKAVFLLFKSQMPMLQLTQSVALPDWHLLSLVQKVARGLQCLIRKQSLQHINF